VQDTIDDGTLTSAAFNHLCVHATKERNNRKRVGAVLTTEKPASAPKPREARTLAIVSLAALFTSATTSMSTAAAAISAITWRRQQGKRRLKLETGRKAPPFSLKPFVGSKGVFNRYIYCVIPKDTVFWTVKKGKRKKDTAIFEEQAISYEKMRLLRLFFHFFIL